MCCFVVEPFSTVDFVSISMRMGLGMYEYFIMIGVRLWHVLKRTEQALGNDRQCKLVPFSVNTPPDHNTSDTTDHEEWQLCQVRRSLVQS